MVTGEPPLQPESPSGENLQFSTVCRNVSLFLWLLSLVLPFGMILGVQFLVFPLIGSVFNPLTGSYLAIPVSFLVRNHSKPFALAVALLGLYFPAFSIVCFADYVSPSVLFIVSLAVGLMILACIIDFIREVPRETAPTRLRGSIGCPSKQKADSP